MDFLLSTGTTTGSFANDRLGQAAGGNFHAFSGSPIFTATLNPKTTTNAVFDFFVGIGSMSATSSSIPYATTNHIGFELTGTGGANATLLATIGDTSGQVTSTLIASVPQAGNNYDLIAVVNGTASVDFYTRADSFSCPL
jgi:hypothetical protein